MATDASTGQETSSFWSPGNRNLVFASLIHAVMIGFGYLSLPPVVDEIGRELHLSDVALSYLWASIPAGSVVGVLIAMATASKCSYRSAVSIGALVASTALLARGSIRAPEPFVAVNFIYGAASAFAYVNLPISVSRYFEGSKNDLAQGVLFGSYIAGAAISVIFIEALRSSFDWHALLRIGGAASLACSLGWVIWAAPYTDKAVGRAGLASGHANSAFTAELLLCYLAYAFFTGAYLGIAGALPLRFDAYGISTTWIAVAMVAPMIASAVGSIVLPMLAERTDARFGVIAACFAIAACLEVSSWVMASYRQPMIATVGATAAGFFMGSVAIYFGFLTDHPAVRASNGLGVMGLATLASYVGGATFPPAGATLARFSPLLEISFFALGGLVLSAVAILLAARRSLAHRRRVGD